jgi:hypothetical protein
MTVYVFTVIMRDRHTDDQIEIYDNEIGAVKAANEFLEYYKEPPFKPKLKTIPRPGCWHSNSENSGWSCHIYCQEVKF